jgi:hypothetical protein
MMAVAVLTLGVLIAMTSVGFAQNHSCIKQQRHELANGTTPAGRTWRVSALIRSQPGCDSWFLKVNFAPSGTLAGSWSWGHDVKEGGHLADGFGIFGEDEVSDVGRVFSGIVGGRATTVAVTLSNGKRLTIHPKLPGHRQRDRLVWLRGFRYFVRFYPVGGRAKIVKLLDAQGKVLEVKGGRSF